MFITICFTPKFRAQSHPPHKTFLSLSGKVTYVSWAKKGREILNRGCKGSLVSSWRTGGLLERTGPLGCGGSKLSSWLVADLATRVSRRSSKSSRSFNIVGSTEGAPSMTSSISSMVSMVSLLNFVFKSPLQCTAKTLPTPSNACLEDQSDKFHTVCWWAWGFWQKKQSKKSLLVRGHMQHMKKASSQGPTLNFAVMFEHTFGLDITRDSAKFNSLENIPPSPTTTFSVSEKQTRKSEIQALPQFHPQPCCKHNPA